MEQKNKPERSVRYGSVEGSIWKNEGENGPFYNATFSRRYKQGEEWKSTSSFSEADLPTLAKAALDLHSMIQTLKGATNGKAE